jgi:hypothetical protein
VWSSLFLTKKKISLGAELINKHAGTMTFVTDVRLKIDMAKARDKVNILLLKRM